MASIASTSLSRDGLTRTGSSLARAAVSFIGAIRRPRKCRARCARSHRPPCRPLDLDVEARERVEAGLEHLEIIDHGFGPLRQPLAGHDGGDAGRIDHERCGGDAAGDRLDRQIVDIVAEQIARGIAGDIAISGMCSGMNCLAWSALTSAARKKRCISPQRSRRRTPA